MQPLDGNNLGAPAAMKCVWVNPTLEPQVLIIILLLVTLMSAPVYGVLSYIIDCYVLAPTTMGMEESDKELGLARQSTINNGQTSHNMLGSRRYGWTSEFNSIQFN